jgi:fructose/tagatose bisphosphate aldolase
MLYWSDGAAVPQMNYHDLSTENVAAILSAAEASKTPVGKLLKKARRQKKMQPAEAG